MVKMMILFRRSDAPDFEERYNRNLALLEGMPGIKRREASLVTGTPEGVPPFYRILELYFEDRAALERALLSPEGQAAGRDLMDYARHDAIVLYADVYEE
jgi:uncharacterized protein (TIGR02118 family)